MADLLRDGLGHALDQPCRACRRRHSAVTLPRLLAVLRTAAVLRAALSCLAGAAESARRGLSDLPDSLAGAAERLPCSLPRLADSLADAANRLPDSLARLPESLADAANRLPGSLPQLPERLACAADELVQVARGLPGPLADIAHSLAGALADIADSLAGTLADIAHGLPGAFADVAHGLAGPLSDILERSLGSLPDLLGGVAGLVDRLARALTDLRDRTAQPLHELGVAVEARHQAIDDRRDVIEPGLQQRFHFDAPYVQHHAAEVDVDPDIQLDEIQHIGLDGQMGVEVVELEVDQINPQLRHVEEDVGRTTRIAFLAAHEAPVLARALVVAPPRALRRPRSVSALPAA